MSERECACGCGHSLRGRDYRAKYFSDSCRYKARDKRRSLSRPFRALDGEGETHPKLGHIYTLLASRNSDIGSKRGLSTEDCLEFLLDLPRGSWHGERPIYVWFAFDYDVNMMLADLPLKGENSIETLRAENTVYWRGYRITYLRRKIFRIARGKRRHTSYDVWGFFQSNFETACAEWNVPVAPIIQEGKKARSGFHAWSLQKIRAYNHAELDALELLSEALRKSVEPLQLPIQSWHGPAALAAAWLRKNKVKEWLPEHDSTEKFKEICSRAYFGGRIDVRGYGIVDPVYHYDIVSAYPAAIANLPSLANLKWKRRGKKLDCGSEYVARIRWTIPATYWSPLPWRSENGSIRYPLEGEGWYWAPEIEAAIERYGREHFEILDSYVPDGELSYPFRQLIEETFAYRAELKAAGNYAHRSVRLVLNSLYGKFAQTVGKASYHSPIWAGLITSQTRAQLLRALSPGVVCIMTDSIWSQTPLELPLGSGLGDWERQDDARLALAEAGLYEASSPAGEVSRWQRGFDRKNPLDVEKIVQRWLGDEPDYRPTFPVQRFVGMGLASVTSHPWRQWIDLDRAVEPVPLVGTTKRLPFFPSEHGERKEDFVSLHLRPRDSQTLSAQYKKITFDADLVAQRMEDECFEE